MPFSFHRRRKTSSSPSPDRRPDTTSRPANGSVMDHVGPALRSRNTRSTSQDSFGLPSSSPQKRNRPTILPLAIMNPSHYSNDKRRRRRSSFQHDYLMRRRIRAVMLLFAVIVVLWWILLPLITHLLSSNRRSRLRNDPLQHLWMDPLLRHAPPLSADQARLLQLEEQRRQSSTLQDRRSWLEQVAPVWAHRLESSHAASGNNNAVGHRRGAAAAPPPTTTTSSASTAVTEVHDTGAQNHHVEPNPIMRTLHNMHEYRAHGACHGASSSSSSSSSRGDGVTLVLQSSVERLWLVPHTCARWWGGDSGNSSSKNDDDHPIVLVVPVDTSNAKQVHEVETWQATTLLASCPNLIFVRHDLLSSKKMDQADYYPVNQLRNLGLDQVRTSHVLVADVDFVPSHNLAATLRAHLPAPGHAVVVPAFERRSNDCATPEACQRQWSQDVHFVPADVAALRTCMHSNDCQSFQADVNWEGHSSTRSDEWLRQDNNDFTAPRPLQCFDSLRYEPYVVIPWCPMTMTAKNDATVGAHERVFYDERFYGYGKNKIEYVQHLRLMGTQFAVLPPTGFLLHYPHVESAIKAVWNDRDQSLHAAMDALYPQFLRELVKMYASVPSDRIVQACDRHHRENK